MKTAKRQKLMVQMSLIAVVIFIVTLSYIVVSDYYITRNAFLSSKNEMIGRDMKMMCDDLRTIPSLEWFLGYIKENEDDVKRELTPEEEKVNESDEFQNYSSNLIINAKDPSSDATDLYKLLYAKQVYSIIALAMKTKTYFNYSSMSFMQLKDDKRESMICSITSDMQLYNEYDGIELGTVLEYELSEHSALEKILSGELDNKDNIIYETYYDSEEKKYYYIGYSSIITIGDERYIECVEYDWSNFHSELIDSALSSMIMGFIILVIIDALLMLLIYFKAISPIQKVTGAILKYKESKSSNEVSEKMGNIKVKNEIGVLAESFSELTTEIDRHTDEILKLNSEKEHIAAELNVATQIQADALPKIFPAFPDRTEFDIYASMTPAKEVGGDFYDFFLIDDDHLAMVMADVSGKGVPAALFMMKAKTLIKNSAQFGEYSPAKILTDVNDQLCEGNEAELFVTVWFAIIEISTGKGLAANAGHESPALKRSGGEFELIKYKHSPAVASIEGIRFREHEFEMFKGDTVFMYTDGVPEANNKDNKLFGNQRMIDALNVEPNASNEKLLKNVRKAVDEFVGDAPQFDDLTMLSFTYFGKEDK